MAFKWIFKIDTNKKIAVNIILEVMYFLISISISFVDRLNNLGVRYIFDERTNFDIYAAYIKEKSVIRKIAVLTRFVEILEFSSYY